MIIHSVYDDDFRPYGKVLIGCDTAGLIDRMNTIAMPDSGTAYEPSITLLEKDPLFRTLFVSIFGAMPIQLGMCWGYNTRLNCLEYHRSSEINIPADDVVLLLAKLTDIHNGMLDVSAVQAFRVNAGIAVEIYATTLHYAPCRAEPPIGFRVAVVLPLGTNTAMPAFTVNTDEDRLLTARNKWLLAHPSSDEAAGGAQIRLIGKNLDIAKQTLVGGNLNV